LAVMWALRGVGQDVPIQPVLLSTHSWTSREPLRLGVALRQIRRRDRCAVDVVDFETQRRVVQLEYPRAHEALVPDVAGARMDLHEPLILAEHDVLLQARYPAVSEPPQTSIVELAARRDDLDDDDGLSDHRGGVVGRAAGDDHVWDSRDLVGRDLRAIDQRLAAPGPSAACSANATFR
jgi:hypothetical protein